MSNVFPTSGAVPGASEYQPISPVLAAIYRLYSAPRGACRPSLDLDAFNRFLEEVAALYDLSGLAGDALGAGSKLLPNGVGNLANAVKMMAWKAQTPCLSELTVLGIVPANGFPRSYVDDSGVSSVMKQWDCETLGYMEVGSGGGDAAQAQNLTLTAPTTLTPAQFNWHIKLGGSLNFETTLPTPVDNGGKGRYYFYNTSAVAQTIAMGGGSGFGGPYGTGASTFQIPPATSCLIISDDSNWLVFQMSDQPITLTSRGITRGATVPYGLCGIGDIVSGAAIAASHASVTYGGVLVHDANPALWPGTYLCVGSPWSDGYSNSKEFVGILL